MKQLIPSLIAILMIASACSNDIRVVPVQEALVCDMEAKGIISYTSDASGNFYTIQILDNKGQVVREVKPNTLPADLRTTGTSVTFTYAETGYYQTETAHSGGSSCSGCSDLSSNPTTTITMQAISICDISGS